MPNSPDHDTFVLTAFDRDQWCPVLQARFHVDDLEALRSVLGIQAGDDLELRHQYEIDHNEMTAVVKRFAVAFDPDGLLYQRPQIFLVRQRIGLEAPYLIHTGYELPLLLDGRKKLARMDHNYPPATFEGEDRFDHLVAGSVTVLAHRELPDG